MDWFWNWVHLHHDDLQALGPVATILAALVAVVVTGALGFAQWRIARAQRDIALDKLKLELFEKRYAIYQAALDLCRALRPSYKRIPYEEFGELQYKLQEAMFLFSPKVVALTDRLRTLSREWEDRIAESSKAEVSTNKRDDLLADNQQIPQEMDKLWDTIGGTFWPELSFDALTRKK